MTRRDDLYALAAKTLARLLYPVAHLSAPGRARHVACQWALAVRYPRESLAGLTPAAHHAFTTARTEAFWRDGVLIGLTSGYRDAAEQHRIYVADQDKPGLPRALPPAESPHVRGLAMDVRPREGARWLEEHGSRHHLYRTYDNEWWHFELHPTRPIRLPYPGARIASTVRTRGGTS
ncbi:D-alanyl-D-alanine carboxypeptidase family protein [Actinokineospora enzanensis]|uniref:D-alanyl-D-alanine carboxypeptidase family protein n=1 Tax=Actinokineospora enzanensis TaxID=155975 RepID=UPI0005246C8E|nr:D-alanyl-D-alanine carboxypeptidase family protein [Actinokineospora enzanensis]